MGVVQRVPLSILSLLGMKGFDNLPDGFSKTVVPTIDMFQAFGVTALQWRSANNAAAAAGTGISVTLSATDWCVLFSATGTVGLTATMTSGWGQVNVRRQGASGAALTTFAGDFSGTSAIAGNQTLGGILPYPLLCPPGTTVAFTPEALGTDPTANITVVAEFGLLS